MTTRPGGFGRQNFGIGFFGAGGPLTVVRALAVAGQVVRVTFNEEPTHRTAAGISDALNPSNYVFTVPGGNAVSPTPVGVNPAMVVGPARGVGNGGSADERGFDVSVDRQLVVGVVYQVAVRNLTSAAGGALGSPTSAQFGGVVVLTKTQLPERNQDLVDIANPVASGHWVVDASSDLATEDPDTGTRKRIYRRLFTKRNAFKFLIGYGLAIDLKGVGTVAGLAALKTDAIRQVGQEPDVASVSVTVSLQASGLTLINARAKTRRGSFVDVGAQVSLAGAVTASPA